MKATLLIICVCTVFNKTAQYPPRLTNYYQLTDLNFTQTLLLMTVDLITDTSRRISALETLQKQNSDCAAFELGYVAYVIQDKYRKMVDIYNTSVFMGNRLYLAEHILNLQGVEHLYWEITHLTGMLHEIERKYGKESRLDVVYDEVSTTTLHSYAQVATTFKRVKTTRFKFNKYIKQRRWTPRRKRKRKWWPLEYGWEINYYW